MPVFTTACPRNCYSTCTMRVYTKNGRLRMIEPHPDNNATSEGICLKGMSYVERVYSPDRILYPLYREDPHSGYNRIPWSKAIDLLASKISFFKEKYGAQSILYYFGSGTKGLLNEVGLDFWRLFGGCTTTYGDLCWPAGLEATRLTLGENKHNAPCDIANAKLIILWGKNPAETNVHQMPHIEKALESGARLIVIDPRRTQSAERAELLVQPRPGTDGVIALAIAHLLIKNEQVDLAFISKHLLGFQRFRQMVLEMTPKKASQISDIPEKTIHRLAEHIGTIKPLTINVGYGMQRYANSGQTLRAIIALLAITGNIGKPGAGWIYANLQSHIFEPVKDPIAFYPPNEPDGNIRKSISTALLGEQILSSDQPPIKMIWVERGNPVTQNPDTNRVLRAFRSMEFRVVIEQFMTDTARQADLILPAKTMFEQSDVIGAYWHAYIQLKQKIIEPPGEVKPESEIYYLLAKKLGYSKEQIKNKIPGPSDENINKYLAEKLKPFAELTLERLKKGPVYSPMDQPIAFEDLKFPTPSGKIELYSEETAQRWALPPLPEYQIPLENQTTGKNITNKYPLQFMTPNTKNSIHSQFNNLKYIRQFSENPTLQIHPEDAEIRGITTGDRVKVYNDRGFILTDALIDYSIRPGCIAMSNGWWITDGGTVNFLSLGRETDMGYGAAFHENLVEVKRVK